MIGGDLPHNAPQTTALLTDDEVLAVDQHSTGGHPVIQSAGTSVWTARPENGRGYYAALFNTSEEPEYLHYSWQQLGWPPGNYVVRDLWEHTEATATDGISIHLAPHASVLYRARALNRRE
jgi:hypothetical protein